MSVFDIFVMGSSDSVVTLLRLISAIVKICLTVSLIFQSPPQFTQSTRACAVSVVYLFSSLEYSKYLLLGICHPSFRLWNTLV